MDYITFKDLLELTTVNMSSVGTLSWVAIVLNLLVSLVIGVAIAFTYRKAFVGILFQKSFAIALVLTALVTTMVIMVISGNLVLSLGMVGALSIVRFRAAIKDPIDIVYMFWAVGVGIANGVGVYSISLISSLLIGLILMYITRFPSKPNSKLIVIKGSAIDCTSVCEKIESIGGKSVNQKSLSSNKNTFEAVYEAQDTSSINVISQELEKTRKEIELRIINYTSN